MITYITIIIVLILLIYNIIHNTIINYRIIIKLKKEINELKNTNLNYKKTIDKQSEDIHITKLKYDNLMSDNIVMKNINK